MDEVSENLRILLVDDDDHVRAALMRTLRRSGGVIEEFSSGYRAIARASETSFDVAVLDISMPEMDGDALALELRQRQPDMRLVFVSADTESEGAQRAKNLTRATFVRKPWATAEMLRVVRG